MQELFDLLVKWNPHYTRLYGADGLDMDALRKMETDDIFSSIVFFEETEPSSSERRHIGELFVTTETLLHWLEVGAGDPTEFPIAGALHALWDTKYRLSQEATDSEGLACAIQGREKVDLASNMNTLADLVSLVKETVF